MRRYDIITEICDAMLTMGWQPYQNDHEDANGQFEMNWQYSDALQTADRHAFFKFMVRSIAEKHGLRATFMPKPFSHLTGNGCHAHLSLWSRCAQTSSTIPSTQLGLSATGYSFMAGLMENAAALRALLNPTVNSDKRIDAPRRSRARTWSPMRRHSSATTAIHDPRARERRFELRLADGSRRPVSFAGRHPRSWCSTPSSASGIRANRCTSTCTRTATWRRTHRNSR